MKWKWTYGNYLLSEESHDCMYSRSSTVTLDTRVCHYTGCTKTTSTWVGIKLETCVVDIDRFSVPACRTRLRQDYIGSRIQEQIEIGLKSQF